MISISGSRYYNNYEYIKNVLTTYNLNNKIINIGDAKGVDALVVKYCKENNIKYNIFYANWNKYGLKAGPIRNEELIKNTELLIAFPEKTSKGTISAINIAKKFNIKVDIYNI